MSHGTEPLLSATVVSLHAAKQTANEAFVNGKFEDATRLYAHTAKIALAALPIERIVSDDVARVTVNLNDAENVRQVLLTVIVNLLAVILAEVDRKKPSATHELRSLPTTLVEAGVCLGSWVLLQHERLQKSEIKAVKSWTRWRISALSFWCSQQNITADNVCEMSGPLVALLADVHASSQHIPILCPTAEDHHRSCTLFLKARFRLARLHRLSAELLQRKAVALIGQIAQSTNQLASQRLLIRTAQDTNDHLSEAIAICVVFQLSSYLSMLGSCAPDLTNFEEELVRLQRELVGLGDSIRLEVVSRSASSPSLRETGSFHSGIALVKQRSGVADSVDMAHQIPLVQHGTGLVAVQPLCAGDVILHEPVPLMEARRVTAATTHADDAYEQRFVQAIEAMMRLWQRVQQCSSAPLTTSSIDEITTMLRILSLHARDEGDDDAEGDDGDLVLERGCDVWHHNAMRIGDEIDFRIKGELEGGNNSNSDPFGYEGGSAVYHIGSRLNHSCRPNAICCFMEPVATQSNDGNDDDDHAEWSLAFKGALTVRLLRDVAAGEEILISYCPVLESIEAKKRHCRSFVCRCDMCRGIFPSSLDPVVEGGETSSSSAGSCRYRGMGGDSGSSGVVALEAVRCAVCGANEVSTGSGSPATSGHRGDCRGSPSLSSAASAAVSAVEAKFGDILSTFAKQHSNSQNAALVRSSSLRQLITLETCSTVLGPRHRLRLRILQEALALGVAASLTEEDSFSLTRAARRCVLLATTLCPQHWPLVTGLRMHLMFCLGRHYVGLHSATDGSGDDGEEEVPALWCDHESADAAEVRDLLALCIRDHVIQFWGSSATTFARTAGVLECFWDRYQAELSSAGITSQKDLNQMMQPLLESHNSIDGH
jgi:hypothetical protein